MWKKIYINAQNIEYDTGKAVLIKMPNRGNYEGYKFWHPSKLVRSAGANGYRYTLSYTENFNFTLNKYGNGKYNSREVLDSIIVDFSVIESEFEIMNDNLIIQEKPKKVKHIPQKLDIPSNVDVVEDLIDEF